MGPRMLVWSSLANLELGLEPLRARTGSMHSQCILVARILGLRTVSYPSTATSLDAPHVRPSRQSLNRLAPGLSIASWRLSSSTPTSAICPVSRLLQRSTVVRWIGTWTSLSLDGATTRVKPRPSVITIDRQFQHQHDEHVLGNGKVVADFESIGVWKENGLAEPFLLLHSC